MTTQYWITSEGLSSGEDSFSLSLQSVACSSLFRVGPHKIFPFRVSLLVRKAAIFWGVMGLGFLSHLRDTSSQQISQSSWLLQSSHPLPQCSLDLRCRSRVTVISTGARYHTVCCSLHFDQLWFYVMLSICCKEKRLWRMVRLELCFKP